MRLRAMRRFSQRLLSRHRRTAARHPGIEAGKGEARAFQRKTGNDRPIGAMKLGRGERIRTSDSCVPNAVLYQAELHPEADGGFGTDRTLA